MEQTCCALYTIRLDALKFKLSRSQKRTLRTWNEFLRFDKRPAVRGDVRVHEHFPGPSAQTKKSKVIQPQANAVHKNRENKKKVIRRNRAIQRMKEKEIDVEQVISSSLLIYLSLSNTVNK